MDFANWAHRNQKRKIGDVPYIIHPLHLRWLLATHGLNPDHDDNVPIFIAADNHDGPEDNPEEVSFASIESLFGAEAARIVKGVTLNPENPDKRLSRQKILGSDWAIQIVKVADILSNTMAKTMAIRKLGLAKVQTYFKQPIIEQIAMERWFLDNIQLAGVPMPLIDITESALAALDELKAICKP